MINFIILAFALVVQGVERSEQHPQSDTEVKRVEAVAKGLIAADNDRDLDRVVDLYAPDAVLLPPGEPPIEGLSAIRPRYAEFFKTHHPAIVITIEETVVAADLAYVRGRTRGSIRDLGGVADRSLKDVYMMILRRNAAGDWKISRLMWHSEGDPDDSQ